MPIYHELARYTYYQMPGLQLEVLKQKAIQLKELNAGIFKEATQQYNEILKLARAVYGPGSNEYRYLYGRPINQPPDLMKQFHKVERLHAQWVEKEDKRLKAQANQKRTEKRRVLAVEELKSRGYEEGKDFVAYEAISFLKDKDYDRYMEIRKSVT